MPFGTPFFILPNIISDLFCQIISSSLNKIFFDYHYLIRSILSHSLNVISFAQCYLIRLNIIFSRLNNINYYLIAYPFDILLFSLFSPFFCSSLYRPIYFFVKYVFFKCNSLFFELIFRAHRNPYIFLTLKLLYILPENMFFSLSIAPCLQYYCNFVVPYKSIHYINKHLFI